MANPKPNILCILADQLRARSLPVYGERQIETPCLTRLAEESTVFSNAISTCPVCTPYRSMLVTGRHPQSTGHLVNFVNTRHDEISIGDAFSHAGYRTGWIGKWHLHRGVFPQTSGPDHVPQGRERLGFQWWRGYNFHMDYFNGTVNCDDWKCERWDGYETEALSRYANEFLNDSSEDPFCLFVSPHQPHWTGGQFVPEEYYERLPADLALPHNVPDQICDSSLQQYRHYLAMILALDEMVGRLLSCLRKNGLLDNTIVLFTSDHGTQMGSHGLDPWRKMVPYEESIHVPMLIRNPERFLAGKTCDTLVAPVDIFPSLCTLCGVPIPRTVEGHDLSDTWMGRPGGHEQDALLTMNFTGAHNHLLGGAEWRGVRTQTVTYVEHLNASAELYDLEEDPLQENNLANSDLAQGIEADMKAKLADLMAERNDKLAACACYSDWFDAQRRVVKNVNGPLPNPEIEPDWTLL